MLPSLLRRATRVLSMVALPALVACGGGGTSDDAGGAAPTPPPAAGDVTFTVMPDRASLFGGDSLPLVVLGGDGSVTWVSSDPSVAAVDAAGRVSASRAGDATLTATSGGQTATVRLSVHDPAAGAADPSSGSRIAQALADGRLTPPQALLYRTFAHFGDPRLPADLAGAPTQASDHGLLGEITEAFDTLPADIQAQLRPFLLPPAKVGSWYAAQLPGAAPLAGAPAAARRRAQAAGLGCDLTDSAVVRGDVTSPNGLFRIHYQQFRDPVFDRQARALAELVASFAEEVSAAETGLLGFGPLDDSGEPCHGEDGALDIYLTPLKNVALAGQAVAYHFGSCQATPSFMLLNTLHPLLITTSTAPNPAGFRDALKSVFAHEFMHVLQMAMARSGSCADLKWFDEATAQWAIDHVVPAIPTGVEGAPGIEDGMLRLASPKKRTGSFLTQYLYAGHRQPLEGGSADYAGYPSYLFFQYVARTRGPAAVASVFGQLRTRGDQPAVAVTSLFGFRGLWSAFAASLWNDTANGVGTFWNGADGYDFGLADLYHETAAYAGVPPALRPVPVKLEPGQAQRAYDLLADSGRALPPRSLSYQVFTFADEAVKSVSVRNAFAGSSAATDVSVQAYAKVNGAWKPLEDWTSAPTRHYCRNKPEEHLEELVLVFANGATDALSEDVAAPPTLQLTAADRCAWDAVQDFSPSQNPHGAWSYGSLPLAGLEALRLFSRPYATDGVDYWFDATNSVIGTPTVAHDSLATPVTTVHPDWQAEPITTISFLPDELIVHPSRYPGPTTYSVVRFTAPQDGDYAVSATFTGRDSVGATVDVYVIRRTPGDESFMLERTNLSPARPSVSLPRTEIHLDKDVALDFIVGPGFGSAPSTEYLNDSTGLKARVERVR